MAQTFIYNSGTYQETNSGTIHLEFGLFFDGTLNNKNNTDLRLKMLNREDLIILPSDNVNTVTQKEELIRKRRERFENDELTDTDKSYLGLVFKDIKSLEQALEKETQAGLKSLEISKEIVGYYNADKRSLADKQGVDNSLMNDYTNVARMWACCNENYAIYIEGIGTLDKQKDISAGFQFGSGDTGIRGKVRRGCYELAMKIKNRLPKETNEFVEVTLDVFGFSRGAAAARNFLYEVNVFNKREEDTKIDKKFKRTGRRLYNEGNRYGYNEYAHFYYDKDKVRVNIDFFKEDKWPKYGYLGYYLLKDKVSPEVLDRIRLEIRFVGIYDTVSSYEEFGNISGLDLLDKGIQHSSESFFKDDVEQLQLNNLGKFQKAVHFTAMNEHRENFALTKMRVENCIEKTFPGVHCDIGGAYETTTEYVDEIEIDYDIINHVYLDLFQQYLISEHWYKEEQLDQSFDKMYYKLSGTRFLRKEYSYIPLHFMQQFFNDILGDSYANVISRNIVTDYPISDPQDEILIKVKERLRKYVFRDENKKEEERSEEEKEWRFIPDCEIENKYNQIRDEVLMERTQRALKEMSKKEKRGGKEQKEERLVVRDRFDKNIYFPPEKQTREGEREINLDIYSRNSVFEEQKILRILRNKYLHWSANRDWFGMQPTSDRKRKEY
jgi:hypothetical protein